MEAIQHESHPKSIFIIDLGIKITKLIENLKLRGKMEINFIEETLKRCSSILSSFSLILGK